MASNRQLNTLLKNLLEQLETSETVALTPSLFLDWDEQEVTTFIDAGLLREHRPLTSLSCDGCGQGCLMPVEWRIDDGTLCSPIIICDKRDDVGSIDVPRERLQVISMDIATLASVLDSLFASDQPPHEEIQGRLWFLGRCTFGKTRHAIFLARGASWPDSLTAVWESAPLKEHVQPIVLTLSSVSAPEGIATLRLNNLLSFQGGILTLDQGTLSNIVSRPKARPKGDEFYIRYERYDRRVLLNDNYVLARPRDDSSNAELMAYLCMHPNQDIPIEAVEKLSPNIHQALNRLGFTGKRKTAFFSVNKQNLRFHNPVDSSRLVASGVKKAEILAGLKTQ